MKPLNLRILGLSTTQASQKNEKSKVMGSKSQLSNGEYSRKPRVRNFDSIMDFQSIMPSHFREKAQENPFKALEQPKNILSNPNSHNSTLKNGTSSGSFNVKNSKMTSLSNFTTKSKPNKGSYMSQTFKSGFRKSKLRQFTDEKIPDIDANLIQKFSKFTHNRDAEQFFQKFKQFSPFSESMQQDEQYKHFIKYLANEGTNLQQSEEVLKNLFNQVFSPRTEEVAKKKSIYRRNMSFHQFPNASSGGNVSSKNSEKSKLNKSRNRKSRSQVSIGETSMGQFASPALNQLKMLPLERGKLANIAETAEDETSKSLRLFEKTIVTELSKFESPQLKNQSSITLPKKTIFRNKINKAKINRTRKNLSMALNPGKDNPWKIIISHHQENSTDSKNFVHRKKRKLNIRQKSMGNIKNLPGLKFQTGNTSGLITKQEHFPNIRHSRSENKLLGNLKSPQHLREKNNKTIQNFSSDKGKVNKSLGNRRAKNMSLPDKMKAMKKKPPLNNFTDNQEFQESGSNNKNRIRLADVQSSILEFQQKNNTTYRAPLMLGVTQANKNPSSRKRAKLVDPRKQLLSNLKGISAHKVRTIPTSPGSNNSKMRRSGQKNRKNALFDHSLWINKEMVKELNLAKNQVIKFSKSMVKILKDLRSICHNDKQYDSCIKEIVGIDTELMKMFLKGWADLMNHQGWEKNNRLKKKYGVEEGSLIEDSKSGRFKGGLFSKGGSMYKSANIYGKGRSQSLSQKSTTGAQGKSEDKGYMTNIRIERLEANTNLDELAFQTALLDKLIPIDYGCVIAKVIQHTSQNRYIKQTGVKTIFNNDSKTLRIPVSRLHRKKSFSEKYHEIQHLFRFYSKLIMVYQKAEDMVIVKKGQAYSKMKKEFKFRMGQLDNLKFKSSLMIGKDLVDVKRVMRDYTKKLEISKAEKSLQKKGDYYYVANQIKDFEKFNGKLVQLDEVVKRNNNLVS